MYVMFINAQNKGVSTYFFKQFYTDAECFMILYSVWVGLVCEGYFK